MRSHVNDEKCVQRAAYARDIIRMHHRRSVKPWEQCPSKQETTLSTNPRCPIYMRALETRQRCISIRVLAGPAQGCPGC